MTVDREERQRGDTTPADVGIEDIAPVGRSATVLVAEEEGRMERTISRETGDDAQEVTTEHSRPGTMPMYKPTERGGYVPRTVSVSSLRLLIRQGWKEFCPDCNGRHINKAGMDSTDPNLCAARDPVAVRVCPVCSKRIYDNVIAAVIQMEDGGDPNVIVDDAYQDSTPESRTKLSLDVHLWVRHTQWAQMHAVPPLPTAMRDMLGEEAKAV